MSKAKRQIASRRTRPGLPEATAVPTTHVALIERLRPWLLGAMVALFVVRPLYPSEAAPEAGDNLPTIMLWLLLAVFWLLASIRAAQFRLRLGAVDATVTLVVGWQLVASVWAAVHSSPRAAVNSLWLWIGYGVSFVLARQLIASRREARAVLVVMLALAAGVAAYGLDQYFYEIPKTRDRYLKDPDAELRAIGEFLPRGTPERTAFENRLFASEPPATFALTNSLAGFLVPWLAVSAGVAVCGWRSRQRWRITVGASCFALLMTGCLLFTKSRSGYVATLAGLPLAWWACQRHWRLNWKVVVGTLAGIALLAAFATTTGGLNKQVASEATKSLGYRLQYWQAAWKMVVDHPLLGHGPGHFRESYTAYKLPESSEEITDPHDFLLELAATAGIPASLAFLATLGLFAWTLLISTRRPNDGSAGPDPDSARGASASLPEMAAADDASRFVLGGGVIGILAAVPLRLLGSAPPPITSIAIVLPLAVGVMVTLWPWVREGCLPELLPGVGVAVLLINLLAAGAMSYSGVIGSLWLLMAIGLNTATMAEPRRVPPAARWALLGSALVTALACYATAYAPVFARQLAVQQAQEQPSRAMELLEEAVAADPLAVEPRLQWAEAAFVQWQQHPSPETLAQFERLQQSALLRAPDSNVAWAGAGQRYWTIFQTTQSRDSLERAIHAYQHAVERYPTNATQHANLALALSAANDRAAAVREAKEARRLHDLTPHEDKKLQPPLLDKINQTLNELK